MGACYCCANLTQVDTLASARLATARIASAGRFETDNKEGMMSAKHPVDNDMSLYQWKNTERATKKSKDDDDLIDGEIVDLQYNPMMINSQFNTLDISLNNTIEFKNSQKNTIEIDSHQQAGVQQQQNDSKVNLESNKLMNILFRRMKSEIKKEEQLHLRDQTQSIIDRLKLALFKMTKVRIKDLSNEIKKKDRQRIIERYEAMLLQSISNQDFEVSIFNTPDGFVNFGNFKNYNELIQIQYNEVEKHRFPKNINSKRFQFFRVVTIAHRGKIIASGSIIISQEPVNYDIVNTHPEQDLQQNDILVLSAAECEEEFRAIIQYLMLDTEYFRKHNTQPLLSKLLESLEALAWLHNCTKIQIPVGTLSHDDMTKQFYWMVVRSKKLFYNKNKMQDLEKLPERSQEIILKSNEESMANFAFHEHKY